MPAIEEYLKPEVIKEVARLDLKARFIVEGFFAGLHASPYHGFSVEFSEHRKYSPGDDLSFIDWNVYAKTDKFYVKKFEAETNLECHLIVDISPSMNYAYLRPKKASGVGLTKLEYALCLAASLGYLMISQQDAVGLITFDEKVRTYLPPRSKRMQLAGILGELTAAEEETKAAAKKRLYRQTNIADSLHQAAGLIRHRGLCIILSDLLAEPGPVLEALHRLRFAGNEVIIFHILDEAELRFPFRGPRRFVDLETPRRLTVDPQAIRAAYLERLGEFLSLYQRESSHAGIDYVQMDTSVTFDKALVSYLLARKNRF